MATKCHKLSDLKQEKLTLPVLEATSPKSRNQTEPGSLWRLEGRIPPCLFLLLPVATILDILLLVDMSLVSVFIITQHSPLCLCFHVSIRLSVLLNLGLTLIRTNYTSTKTLFSIQVIFWGPGKEVNVGGHYATRLPQIGIPFTIKKTKGMRNESQSLMTFS